MGLMVRMVSTEKIDLPDFPERTDSTERTERMAKTDLLTLPKR